MDSTLETPVNAQPAPSEPSQQPLDDKKEVKGLLAEARATREMLVCFEAAVRKGTYDGNSMLDLAKGMAFLDAILRQNSAHIANLQERLNDK